MRCAEGAGGHSVADINTPISRLHGGTGMVVYHANTNGDTNGEVRRHGEVNTTQKELTPSKANCRM